MRSPVPGGAPAGVAVLLVGAGAAALAAAAAVAGPVAFGEPRWSVLRGDDDPPPAPDPEPTGVQDAATEQVLTLPGWLLPVLGLAAVTLAAAVVVRLLRPGSAVPAPTPTGRGRDATTAPAPSRLAAARPRRAAAAGRAGGARGDPRDDVVRAWCVLEDAAAAAGLPRRETQTPSDFATGLRDRLGGEDVDLSRLLRLYHRARFSTAVLPPGSGEQALHAAADVAAGLRRAGPPQAPQRRTGPGWPDPRPVAPGPAAPRRGVGRG